MDLKAGRHPTGGPTFPLPPPGMRPSKHRRRPQELDRTYKFLAPTIANHARFLEPLNAAVGDRSKSDPIVWTEELDDAFQTAKKSLEQVQPLTMPKPGEQLYMTADASQKGLGATLHRHCDKAVIQHFSKQLSADKKR